MDNNTNTNTNSNTTENNNVPTPVAPNEPVQTPPPVQEPISKAPNETPFSPSLEVQMPETTQLEPAVSPQPVQPATNNEPTQMPIEPAPTIPSEPTPAQPIQADAIYPTPSSGTLANRGAPVKKSSTGIIIAIIIGILIIAGIAVGAIWLQKHNKNTKTVTLANGKKTSITSNVSANQLNQDFASCSKVTVNQPSASGGQYSIQIIGKNAKGCQATISYGANNLLHFSDKTFDFSNTTLTCSFDNSVSFGQGLALAITDFTKYDCTGSYITKFDSFKKA